MSWLVILAPAFSSLIWYVIVWATRDKVPTLLRVAAWVAFPLGVSLLLRHVAMSQPPIGGNEPWGGPLLVYSLMGLALLYVAVPLTIIDIVVFALRRLLLGRPDRQPAPTQIASEPTGQDNAATGEPGEDPSPGQPN